MILVAVIIVLLTRKSSDSARAHRTGRKSFKQRHADQKNLTRHEKKILSQAKQFIVQKRFLQAARLLESIKMERDAITLLEKSGHIHEAAHILLRMRRPNRAGVVYARNNYFTNAAECFIKAGMPLEAAQCARSAGDHKLAAAAFEKVGEFSEAAQSYVMVGAYINAGRCYYKANQVDSSMASYKKKFLQTSDFNYKSLTQEDTHYISTWLSSGHFDEAIAIAAQRTDQMTKVINALAANGHYKGIAMIIPFTEVQDLNRVMAKINYEDASAKTLAFGFQEGKDYERAGMIFEQLGQFQEAAEAFEQVHDFERASYLWGRAGNNERSELAKSKSHSTEHKKPSHHAIEGNFALASNVSGLAKSDSEIMSQTSNAPAEAPSIEFSAPPAPPSTEENMTPPASIPPASIPSVPFNLESAEPPAAPALDLNQPSEEPNSSSEDMSATFSLSSTSDEPLNLTATKPVEKEEDAPKVFFQAPLWIDLTGAECQKIWERGKTISYGKGDVLSTEKENLEGIYVILEGSIEANGDMLSSALKPGDFFGDFAALSEVSSSATFTVTSQTSVRLIKTDELEDLMEEDGSIARKVYKTFTNALINRLSEQQITQLSLKVS